jgi:hypothetical protein
MSALAWMWFMLGRTLESVARPFGRAAIACETRAYRHLELARVPLATLPPAMLTERLVPSEAPSARCCRCSCEAVECATSDGKPDLDFLHFLRDPTTPRHVVVCSPCWREVGRRVIALVELPVCDPAQFALAPPVADEELGRVIRFLRRRASEAVLDGTFVGESYLLRAADALAARIHRDLATETRPLEGGTRS